jgi:hypothetical protein
VLLILTCNFTFNRALEDSTFSPVIIIFLYLYSTSFLQETHCCSHEGLSAYPHCYCSANRPLRVLSQDLNLGRFTRTLQLQAGPILKSHPCFNDERNPISHDEINSFLYFNTIAQHIKGLESQRYKYRSLIYFSSQLCLHVSLKCGGGGGQVVNVIFAHVRC